MEYPVIDAKETGRIIKELCLIKGISAKDISEFMSFSNVQSVYNWFSGKTMPSLDNFYALSRLLGVPMERMISSSGSTGQEVLLYSRRELKRSA